MTIVRFVATGLFVALSAASAQAVYQDGIDISSFQPTVNWTSVKTAGIDFAFTKATEGQNFITQTLLNYNSATKQPFNPAKPCVIKNNKWELSLGSSTMFWRVEQDPPNIPWPQPKLYNGIKAEADAALNYTRYKVTLEMPVGEEARKAALAPPKPAGEPKPAENK